MAGDRERRLAAIVAADVVGYSRLMGVDEAGTLDALRARRSSVIDPNLAQFGGRVVKTTGDGLLIEFPSVVAAVECSIKIQEGMTAANAEIPSDKQIVLRIGVNLGDVIFEDGDIFGDGVNIAARLEQLASPAGICISQAAFDQVRDKLDYRFADAGDHTFKNIARPVRVFRFAPDGAAAQVHRGMRLPGTRGRLAAAAALAMVVGVVGIGAWFGFSTRPGEEGALLPGFESPRLSIAVLPFANLSGDADQDYFADAVTEDLTVDLSRISGSFVISRRSAATYRGQKIDARRIAQELRVRYLLEGTVRRGRNDVRVNVQLTDGETGQQVWSERYEKTAGDMYAFQDEVTGQIARALNLELKEAVSRQAARGGIDNPDANDFALRGWAELWTKPQKPETNKAALDYAGQALAADPANAEALAVIAYAYARGATYGWERPHDEAVEKGIAAGERSVALDSKNADAVYALGFLYYRAGDTRKSQEMMRQCIELNRNHAPAYFFSGINLIRLGKPREAIKWVERAFAISPRDPLRSVWYGTIGRAQVAIAADGQAIETSHKGIAANPNHPHNYAVLASANAHLGQMDKAQAALQKFKQLQPGITLSRYRKRIASGDPVAIKTYKRLLDGLGKAGLND